MITLRRITYGVGITIAISVFVLFVYSVVPQMIQHSSWDQLDGPTEEEMIEKFHGHPGYIAFYERFPDTKEELSYNKKNNHGEMLIGIRNSETGAELVLQLNYNQYTDHVNVHINCHVVNSSERPIAQSTLHANGLFVVDFIEYTDCLELLND